MQRLFKTLEQAFSFRDSCPLCHKLLCVDFDSPVSEHIKVYRYDNKISIEDEEICLQLELSRNDFTLDEDFTIDHTVSYIGTSINGWLITPYMSCKNCEYDIKFQALKFDLSLNKIHKIVLANETLKINQHLIINGFVQGDTCNIYKLKDDYPLVGSLSSNYDFTDKKISDIDSWIKTVTIFS